MSLFSKTIDELVKEGLFNPVTGRYVCSPKHPMPKDHKGRWEHTNSHERDLDSDYGIYYECTDCGQKWFVEIDG